MERHSSTYDGARCPVCGTQWRAHTSGCPRHPYRPAGAEPGGFILPLGRHAGSRLDEVGCDDDGLDYLIELRGHEACDESTRETIDAYLAEAR